jgi:hypothetical protein
VIQQTQPHGTRRRFIFIAIISVTTLLFWHAVTWATAQTADNPWTTPINLSVSGSTSNPQIITDSQGVLHIIWQDSIDDYIYVQGDGATWSEPLPVELPFGTRSFFPDLSEDDPTPLFTPHLAIDAEGIVHAVWIDDIGDLYHSSVALGEFANFEAWTSRVKIATSVLAVAFAGGPDGRLHATYMQTVESEEVQPGIFYTQSTDDGASWLPPVSLHTSLYFRLLEPETVNLQMALANESRIFVAWDDWPHERVLTIRSVDGGVTWGAPNEIDKRQEEDDIGAVGPSGIKIVANNEIVHVIWQAGHEGLTCAQYYQWSVDGGDNWQPEASALDGLGECPSQIQFEQHGNVYTLLANTSDDYFIVPWYGSEWGTPQLQPALSNARDPETFKPIAYTCGQEALGRGDELWLVACGEGESKDIWLLRRSLSGIEVAPEAPIWSPPLALLDTEASVVAPLLVVDETGRFHAFWGEANSEIGAAAEDQATTLFYAQREEELWSSPTTVLDTAGGGSNDLSVAVDRQGLLVAAWRGGEQGEIYFSRVATAQAVLSSEWSEPQPVPRPGSVSSSPVIAVDDSAVIYIVYAVPVNEGRGIYLVKSYDNGESWTEPISVFDGATANWELVDQPRLALSGDGQLHLLWLNRPFSGPGDTVLYYAYSHDGGDNWSEAAVVQSRNQQEATVLWNQIIKAEGNVIHRVWQEWALGQLNLWHQFSPENGRNWSEPIRVAVLNAVNSPTTLFVDRAGQLHLLYFAQSSPETAESRLSLHHWVWLGEQWQREEDLALDKQPILDVNSVAAAITANGQLAALFSSIVEDEEDTHHSLYISNREFVLPEGVMTPQPLPTRAATPTATLSPTLTPEPTPTPFVTVAPLEMNRPVTSKSQSQLVGIITGLLAAAVPVGLLFAVFIINHNRVKYR